MINKEALIDKIVEQEAVFFDMTVDVSGRASCQDDLTTFKIMRRSQFMAWAPEMLISYANDIVNHQQQMMNPVANKYAYMMEYYAPNEWLMIALMVPPISDEKRKLIDEISEIQMTMSEAFYGENPDVQKQSRSVHADDDAVAAVSSETYLRGELATYSELTLKLYKAYIEELAAKGQNIVAMIVNNTAALYEKMGDCGCGCGTCK